MKKFRSFFLACGLLCFLPLAADIPDKPSQPRLVNDYAGILSSSENSSLEATLASFNRETSNQIAVVIVGNLDGYEIADYSFKLGKKWGIGQKELRNGILIVVKPKTTSERGQAFIAIGKGLEGAIPDATCHEIVNREMIPNFKENNYYLGLKEGTNVLMSLARGEYDYANYSKKDDASGTLVFIVIAGFILVFILFRKIFGRQRRGGGLTFGGNGWFIGGGDWGSSSSSGSDSSSDSGFSDFGGGDFGGGGAGGSW